MFTIFFICAIITRGVVSMGAGPPKGKVTILAASECDDPGDTLYEYDFDVREVDGTSKAFCTATIPTDVTEDFTTTLEFEEWKDGQWQLKQKIDGGLWEIIDKFAMKVYKKMSKTFDPNFPEKFPVPAGTYTVANLEYDQDDLECPVVMFGTIRGTMRIFDENEDQVFCKVIEMDSQQQ